MSKLGARSRGGIEARGRDNDVGLIASTSCSRAAADGEDRTGGGPEREARRTLESPLSQPESATDFESLFVVLAPRSR